MLLAAPTDGIEARREFSCTDIGGLLAAVQPGLLGVSLIFLIPAVGPTRGATARRRRFVNIGRLPLGRLGPLRGPLQPLGTGLHQFAVVIARMT
jgi:hypothetical protein